MAQRGAVRYNRAKQAAPPRPAKQPNARLTCLETNYHA